MFKLIAAITPLYFLPRFAGTSTDIQTGITTKIYRNDLECREHFEKVMRNKTFSFLSKYSGFNFIKAKYNLYKINKKSKVFYTLMGELAVTHACIEQDLKNIIRLDLEHFSNSICYDLSSNIAGVGLRVEFLKIIKNHFILSTLYSEYKIFIENFRAASDLRNDTLKALYQFNSATSSVQKVYIPSLIEIRKNIETTNIDLFSNAIKNVNFKDIEKQIADLKTIRSNLNELRSKGFSILLAIQQAQFYLTPSKLYVG